LRSFHNPLPLFDQLGGHWLHLIYQILTLLVKITDQGFGKDKEKWNKWLAENENKIEPVALIERPFG
jgi:hypothetical protein